MTMKSAPQHRSRPESFGQQEVDLTAIVPLPDGYEKLFLALYFITIPYAVGLLFLFLFIAKGNFESFISLDIAMFAAVWGIGYEVCAAITLGVIFYKMFQFNRTVKTEEQLSVRADRETELHHVHKIS
ncbi:MAG: hypothetical protein P8Y51_05975 [Campylobacterales bacterium]